MADFLSCDWGTTSFRLRLVAQGNVVAEVRDQFGIKAIFEKAAGGPREGLFAEFLQAKLHELKPGRAGLPLVISGMASSSIGWKEIPYARAPFALDGSGLRVEQLEWDQPAWLDRTLLVSGVATERDVMRGEETQILGIMAGRSERECVLVLPGTHSKQVRIENGSVVDFQTFMTGELFEVLSKHSVLRATLDTAIGVEPNDSFRDGVRAAEERGLAGSLFSVRARGVLGKIAPAENTSYLSGLLIGSELLGMEGPVLLGASGRLASLYAEAMKVLERSDWISLPPEDVETAVARGQAMILK